MQISEQCKGHNTNGKCSCYARSPCRSLYHFCLPGSELVCNFSSSELHLWFFFGLLSSGYQSHLCRKLGVCGLYILTTTAPTFLLPIQSFKSNWWYARMKGWLTCLGSGKFWGIIYTPVSLQHQAEGVLQKLFTCMASSAFSCCPMSFLVSPESTSLGPEYLSESVPGKLNLKHFVGSLHSTLYFYFIIQLMGNFLFKIYLPY